MTGGTLEFCRAQISHRVVAREQLWIGVAYLSTRSADIVDGDPVTGITDDGPCRSKRLVIRMGKGDQEAPIQTDLIFIERYKKRIDLKNGKMMEVRPLLPSDEFAYRNFFYSLKEETIYLRFFYRFMSAYQSKLALGQTQQLLEIIQETGKQAGFTLILQRGGAGMLYSREALDITDLIVEKYNQKG